MSDSEKIINLLQNILTEISLVKKDLSDLMKVITPDKIILRRIEDLDRRGINKKQNDLIKCMSDIKNYENHFRKLLYSGDIFTIRDVVYPLDTVNEPKL